MIKGKEILGRNIVALSTGEKVDTVRDVVFDHQGNQVLALLTDEGGWFRAAKAVPFDRIRSIGEHAVMIGSPEDVTSSRDDKRLGDALESKTSLIGMALLTTDGQQLGRIADVYFDEHTGKVVGYEATGGLFADMSSGRSFIPAPSDVQIGADAAIVPISVAAAMRENPGGIKGAIKSVGDSVTGAVQSASNTVKEGVQSATESVKEGVQSATTSVKDAVDSVGEAATERQQEFVVGKVSNAEIVADDGTVIIKKGETITPLHAEVAEWHHKLAALVAAATGGVLAGTVDKAAASVKGAYEDMATATKERQKEYAIGKVAGADITNADGAVIVRKGDNITAAQADAAEQAGKLTALATAATGGAIVGVYDAAKDRVEQTYDEVKDAAADKQKAYAVGKVAGSNVVADDGEVIVAKGVTITAHQADRAEQLGKLAALTAAATAGAVTEGVQEVGQRLSASEQDVQDTIGRRVKTDVRAPGGSLLAVQGQIVTPEIVARAENLGLQHELVAATTAQTEGVADNAQQAVAGAGAALAGGVASVTEGASNLFARAKNWISEKVEETEAAIEDRENEYRESRIKEALGRPVIRVILAPDDTVILNVGEVVTNKAIQAAREHGVLDMLLDSVSREAPVIDPLASRPAETGQAALDSQVDPTKQG